MKRVFFIWTMAMVALTLSAAQPLKIGENAPAFSLKGVDGKTVSLKDYNNEKGVILIFTCNTCPYAVAYQDRIIALHNQFAPKGYPVVAINPTDPGKSEGDSFEAMKVRAKEKSFPFPYLFDEQQTVSPAYGASRTPEVFVLKRSDSGFVVAYTGTIDDNSGDAGAVKESYVANAVNALLADKSPEPATTRAVGCGIKLR
jgi:peroxiredoxin